MARAKVTAAKRKAEKKTLFDSVRDEVPHIMELLEDLAAIKLKDTAEAEYEWERVRPNTVLAAIEQHTRNLLIASGLKENPFLDYTNLGDLNHLRDDRTLSDTQRTRLDLLIGSLSVRWPADLDQSRLDRLELLLYRVGAFELQDMHESALDGPKKGRNVAVKNRVERGNETRTKVLKLEAELRAKGVTERSMNKRIALALDLREQYIGRVRKSGSLQKK